jgi:hypothetical protein
MSVGSAHAPTSGNGLFGTVARHTLRPHQEGHEREREARGALSLTPQVPPEGQVRVQDYVKGELSKDTNWWGAFVVGLAGTISSPESRGGAAAARVTRAPSGVVAPAPAEALPP